MASPKIDLKWDWVSDVHVYIEFDALIWFWCENPSNIWELNDGPQMCGTNKLTG